MVQIWICLRLKSVCKVSIIELYSIFVDKYPNLIYALRKILRKVTYDRKMANNFRILLAHKAAKQH